VVHTTCFDTKMKLTLSTQCLRVLHGLQKETAIVSLSNIGRSVFLICRYMGEVTAQLETWLATGIFVSLLHLSYRRRSLSNSCLLHAKSKAAKEWICMNIFQPIFSCFFWCLFFCLAWGRNFIILNVKMCGLGWLSRHSDSLKSGRLGHRIPAGMKLFTPVKTSSGAHIASCENG